MFKVLSTWFQGFYDPEDDWCAACEATLLCYLCWRKCATLVDIFHPKTLHNLCMCVCIFVAGVTLMEM